MEAANRDTANECLDRARSYLYNNKVGLSRAKNLVFLIVMPDVHSAPRTLRRINFILKMKL